MQGLVCMRNPSKFVLFLGSNQSIVFALFLSLLHLCLAVAQTQLLVSASSDTLCTIEEHWIPKEKKQTSVIVFVTTVHFSKTCETRRNKDSQDNSYWLFILSSLEKSMCLVIVHTFQLECFLLMSPASFTF